MRQRHPVALLALVAGVHPRPLDRDQIATYLWPESDEARARNSLRQALFQIRSDLGDEVFVEHSSGRIALNVARVSCDLWEFRDALENNRLEAAVDAYGGEFLDGFRIPGGTELEEWCDGVRRELRLSFIEALDAIGNRATAEGRFDDAVALRRRLAAVNPLSSRVALSLLRALADAGDRAGALQYATVYEALVQDRLEVEPDAAVADFVERLREDPSLAAYVADRKVQRERESVAREDTAPGPAATPAPTDPASSARPGAPSPDLLSGWVGRMAAVIVLVGFGFAMGRWQSTGNAVAEADVPAGALAIVGTGLNPVEGRDPSIRLVDCSGPSCPDGRLPQDAFVVPPAGEFAAPDGGTNFISPVAGGTTWLNDGPRECCTTAVFETVFETPPGTEFATLELTSLADDGAIFELNGVEFGRHVDRASSSNYAAPAARFVTEFVPPRDGRNVLRVTLTDSGGLLGLQFHGVVRPVDEDSGDAGPVRSADGNGIAGGTEAVTVLASGARQVAGRDPELRIVACEGPGCPVGDLPQTAWVVPKAGAYALPARGTNYVSTLPNGTRLPEAGLDCCTTAVFEMEFASPSDARTARLFLTSLADNRAVFEVNGIEFGRHGGDIYAQNFAVPEVFTFEFVPNLDAPNVLRVTLENGGGLLALQFQAFVSYD